MTRAQVELLLKCIHAVRFSQRESLNPITQGGRRAHDYELVEVGRINGVNKKTAESLVAMGLLVEDMPSYATEYTATHVRLPRYDELENH